MKTNGTTRDSQQHPANKNEKYEIGPGKLRKHIQQCRNVRERERENA